jgi:hypothetical protein
MSAQYYVDGTTLSNSTAVYMDSGLTVCAPAGYYSDGFISRYLNVTSSGCFLDAPADCPSCAEPCGGTINASGQEGVYKVTLDVGGTPSDVGAIVVSMNPYSVADGVKVDFGTNSYNAGVRKASGQSGADLGGGVSNSAGYAAGTPGNYTVVGTQRSSCSVTNIPGTYNLTVYNYLNGSFVDSGNTESVTILPTDIVLLPSGSSYPLIEDFVLVVPKPNTSPNIITISIIGVCSSTQWVAAASCPSLLTAFSSQLVPLSSKNTVCDLPLNDNLYCVSTTSKSSTTIPQIRDQVFEDPYGNVRVTDGWRTYNATNGRIRYETNLGVVTMIEGCPTNNPV